MIRLLLLTLTGFICTTGYTQQKSDLSMSVDFKTIAGLGRMQTTDAFQSYKTGTVTGTQFYNTTWTEGTVTTTRNETISNYLLLYDKVRQELFIRPKDTNLVIQADKSQVKAFTLTMDKPHQFVPAATYDNTLTNNFFEELVPPATGKMYALFKLTKTAFEKADYADMLKVKNGEANDAFVDNVTYYVFHNGALTKITLKEKAVRKALPVEAKKVDAFFTLHNGDDLNESLLVKLVDALN